MTVKELIEELQEHDQYAEIRVGDLELDLEYPIQGIVEEAGDIRIEFYS